MNVHGTLEYTEAQIAGAFEWIFDLVDRCRRSGHLAPCDRMLAGMTDPIVCAEIHTDLILSMLRLTANFSDRLPSWRHARSVAETVLAARGEDARVLLHGLPGQREA